MFGAPPAIRDFIMFAMAYGLLAMSLNLLIGYTGLVSFGHAMFFAAGAYAFGLADAVGQVLDPGRLRAGDRLHGASWRWSSARSACG